MARAGIFPSVSNVKLFRRPQFHPAIATDLTCSVPIAAALRLRQDGSVPQRERIFGGRRTGAMHETSRAGREV
jgi:hypothetical protein